MNYKLSGSFLKDSDFEELAKELGCSTGSLCAFLKALALPFCKAIIGGKEEKLDFMKYENEKNPIRWAQAGDEEILLLLVVVFLFL